jgi:hypothetical protein
MPTPQAYEELHKRFEELRWAAFQMINAISPEGHHSVSEELYDDMWNMVGDCDGPPAWLVKLESN